MNQQEQQQDALEAARDEAAAELRALNAQASEYTRKPAIGPGKLVTPKRNADPLRSGASAYDFAVVAALDPFFLVSECGDMVWTTRRIEDFDAIGDATPEMLDAVEKRLDYETLKRIHALIADAVRTAAEAGVVVTVGQVPRQPFAMGNYDTSIAVRLRRQ